MEVKPSLAAVERTALWCSLDIIAHERRSIDTELADILHRAAMVIKGLGLPTHNLEALERLAILDALEQNDGNRTYAARVLGINLRTLQRKLQRQSAISPIPS